MNKRSCGVYYSVFHNDFDVLTAISNLYLSGEWFDLDPTFSKGVIYQGKFPCLRSDIAPVEPSVDKIDCRKLFFKNGSINSIVFDPPFLFRNDYTKKGNKQKPLNTDKMCNRFSYFQDFDELIQMYIDSVAEFSRVLKPYGYLVFKCQDFTDGSGTRPFYDTHNFVIEICRKQGFSLQDIGILASKNRLIQKGSQGCFRKNHCYYLVFRKEKQSLKYMKTLNRCFSKIQNREVN